jgi:hypothetical protein
MIDVGEAAGLLAKLPQPAAEHVKAIGGSVPGRLLGRTAALLALLALLLGWYALAARLLPAPVTTLQATYPALFNGVFFGLPLLIVAAQLTNEWLQHRRARRMQERVLRGEVRDPGYFRLTPYSARNREEFGRADRAHERVREWIEDAREPILFLTGDSGTGKSSLLAAHVVPALGEQGWLVVSARSYADPLASLRASLLEPGRIWKSPPAEDDAGELLAQAAQRLARSDRRLCVLLDQFEEFVILHAPAARAGFTGLLQALGERPVAGLRLILVLRSEYEAALAEAGLPRLRQGENWFKLGAFTEPAARGFLQRSGLELAPEAFDRLLKGAAALETARGLYRPIVLNLLGLVLARHATRLPDGFDPERVIQTHLRDTVTAPDLRGDVQAVLPRMITDAGTKRPVEEEALASEAAVPVGRVRHCLLRLAEAGLVRPLGREQLVWEIAHDFIATQLGMMLGRLRVPLWRRALPYAVPTLAALWLATVAVVGVWYPGRQVEAAIAALSAKGFTVAGNTTEGFRIGSRELVPGAGGAAVLGQALPVLQPVVSLEVEGDRDTVSLPGLDKLAGLQRLMITGNGALQALPGLDKLAGLRQLTIAGNDALQALPNLAELPQLNELALQGIFVADRLADVAGIEPLRVLVLDRDSALDPVIQLMARSRQERKLPAIRVERVDEIEVRQFFLRHWDEIYR